MVERNALGGGRAPRFFLGRRPDGNRWRFRDDLADDLVVRLESALCGRAGRRGPPHAAPPRRALPRHPRRARAARRDLCWPRLPLPSGPAPRLRRSRPADRGECPPPARQRPRAVARGHRPERTAGGARAGRPRRLGLRQRPHHARGARGGRSKPARPLVAAASPPRSSPPGREPCAYSAQSPSTAPPGRTPPPRQSPANSASSPTPPTTGWPERSVVSGLRSVR